MKRHLSVLSLWVGMTFWGGLTVPALAAALELVLIRVKLPGAPNYYGDFGEFISGAGIDKVFLPALLILCLWLYISCRGANRLTLARLPVSEKTGALWQWVCYMGWFLVLWAVQLGVVLAAYGWFAGASDSRYIYTVTPIIAAYENPFFHWLMPLRDVWGCLLMALLLIGLSFCLAADSVKRRMGWGFPVSTILMGGVTAMCFGRNIDNENWFGVLLCAAVLIPRVVSFCKMRDTEVYG